MLIAGDQEPPNRFSPIGFQNQPKHLGRNSFVSERGADDISDMAREL